MKVKTLIFVLFVGLLPAVAQKADTLVHDFHEAVVGTVATRTKMKGNALETRVAGTELEHAGTAEDVLAKTPGMVKMQDELQVIGRGTPLFYVNGRRVEDVEEIKQIPSEQIQSVDVISNPGAEYPNNVNAVVKIKLRRQKGEGFCIDAKASVQQSTTHGDTDPSGDVLMNYRYRGWDFFAGANVNSFRFYQHTTLDTDTKTDKFTQEQRGTIRQNHVNRPLQLKFGVNWQIDAHHSVGAMIQPTFLPWMNDHKVIDEDVWLNGAFQDHLTSVDDKDVKKGRGFRLNTYYSGQVKKLNIDWNFDMVRNDQRFVDHLDELGQVEHRLFDTDNHSKNDMWATKLVLAYPYKKSVFKVGTEIYSVRYRTWYTTSSGILPSSDTDFTETTSAAFAEYALSSKIGQWTAGLRYEHTNIGHVNDFHPTLSWAKPCGPVMLTVNYSSKTLRPQFWQLREGINYHSRYIYDKGNANLRNSKLRTLSLTAMYKTFVFGADYKNVARKILSWSEPYGDDGTIMLVPRNLSKPLNVVSVYATGRHKVGCWSPNYTAMYSQQFLTLDFDRKVSFNKPMFGVFANNTFEVKTWSFDVNLGFVSPMNQDNVTLRRAMWTSSAAVQKTFLNGNLTLRLEMDDILKQYRQSIHANFGAYQMRERVDRQGQSLTFTVHYRLNAAPSKYKGQGAGEEGRMRSSGDAKGM